MTILKKIQQLHIATYSVDSLLKDLPELIKAMDATVGPKSPLLAELYTHVYRTYSVVRLIKQIRAKLTKMDYNIYQYQHLDASCLMVLQSMMSMRVLPIHLSTGYVTEAYVIYASEQLDYMYDSITVELRDNLGYLLSFYGTLQGADELGHGPSISDCREAYVRSLAVLNSIICERTTEGEKTLYPAKEPYGTLQWFIKELADARFEPREHTLQIFRDLASKHMKFLEGDRCIVNTLVDRLDISDDHKEALKTYIEESTKQIKSLRGTHPWTQAVDTPQVPPKPLSVNDVTHVTLKSTNTIFKELADTSMSSKAVAVVDKFSLCRHQTTGDLVLSGVVNGKSITNIGAVENLIYTPSNASVVQVTIENGTICELGTPSTSRKWVEVLQKHIFDAEMRREGGIAQQAAIVKRILLVYKL